MFQLPAIVEIECMTQIVSTPLTYSAFYRHHAVITPRFNNKSPLGLNDDKPRWRHDMDMFTVDRRIPVTKEPITWSFDFVVVNFNQLLNKDSSCRRYKTPWHLWYANVITTPPPSTHTQTPSSLWETLVKIISSFELVFANISSNFWPWISPALSSIRVMIVKGSSFVSKSDSQLRNINWYGSQIINFTITSWIKFISMYETKWNKPTCKQ